MACVHHIPGRLRIRCSGVRRDHTAAAAVHAELQALEGVRSVEVSALTGNIVIHYDHPRISAEDLFASLAERGYLADSAPPAPHRQGMPAPHLPEGLPALVGKAVVSMAAEKLLERSALALIAALV